MVPKNGWQARVLIAVCIRRRLGSGRELRYQRRLPGVPERMASSHGAARGSGGDLLRAALD